MEQKWDIELKKTYIPSTCELLDVFGILKQIYRVWTKALCDNRVIMSRHYFRVVIPLLFLSKCDSCESRITLTSMHTYWSVSVTGTIRSGSRIWTIQPIHAATWKQRVPRADYNGTWCWGGLHQKGRIPVHSEYAFVQCFDHVFHLHFIILSKGGPWKILAIPKSLRYAPIS